MVAVQVIGGIFVIFGLGGIVTSINTIINSQLGWAGLCLQCLGTVSGLLAITGAIVLFKQGTNSAWYAASLIIVSGTLAALPAWNGDDPREAGFSFGFVLLVYALPLLYLERCIEFENSQSELASSSAVGMIAAATLALAASGVFFLARASFGTEIALITGAGMAWGVWAARRTTSRGSNG
jgi:hypothetical protein